jgi:hypothetical protein
MIDRCDDNPPLDLSINESVYLGMLEPSQKWAELARYFPVFAENAGKIPYVWVQTVTLLHMWRVDRIDINLTYCGIPSNIRLLPFFSLVLYLRTENKHDVGR